MYYLSLSLTVGLVLKSLLSDISSLPQLFFPFHLHEIFFPSLYFLSICIFQSEMVLLEAAYIWILFLIDSATLCLLVGAFKPFTFKLIIDRYVFSSV